MLLQVYVNLGLNFHIATQALQFDYPHGGSNLLQRAMQWRAWFSKKHAILSIS